MPSFDPPPAPPGRRRGSGLGGADAGATSAVDIVARKGAADGRRARRGWRCRGLANARETASMRERARARVECATDAKRRDGPGPISVNSWSRTFREDDDSAPGGAGDVSQDLRPMTLSGAFRRRHSRARLDYRARWRPETYGRSALRTRTTRTRTPGSRPCRSASRTLARSSGTASRPRFAPRPALSDPRVVRRPRTRHSPRVSPRSDQPRARLDSPRRASAPTRSRSATARRTPSPTNPRMPRPRLASDPAPARRAPCPAHSPRAPPSTPTARTQTCSATS